VLEGYGEEKLQWVNHTHEVLLKTEKLISSLKDAETGQRGFIITRDSSYLEPYNTGVTDAKNIIADLKVLTEDNPDQRSILRLVEREMLLKLEELAETVQLVQGGLKIKAVEIVGLNQGKRYMDNIREFLETFAYAELVLLETRKGDFRSNRTQIYTLISVEVALFIGLSVFTLSFLRRSFFQPLMLLLESVRIIESGDKLKVSDVIENTEMGHLLATFYEMSERVNEREIVLTRKAHHDELTGLKNRITMSDEIQDSISEIQKTGGKIAVLFLDLNDFKQVNDTLGHDVGDLVLKETADRISSSVRSSDIVFRIGGDEFLVLAKNIVNISDVHSLVDNIVNAFDGPAIIDGEPMDISISIGVAVAPDNANNSSELVEFADVAMYAAKREKDGISQMFDTGMLRRTTDISKYLDK
jgi:diguanylate cyclase (GGDEF)-like protein